MNIQSILLKTFRNYQTLETSFSPTINVIYGENAQGKTNLLEAIAFLSAARSHRTRFDRELISFDAETAHIQADINAHSRSFTLEAILHRGSRRQLRANGVPLKTISELSGLLHTILFCPEDLSIIRAGAVARRRFLVDCICQLRPKYTTALTEYRRLYDHKTRILRDWREKPSLLEPLEEFNTRMAQVGAFLISYRAHFIRRLEERVKEIHRDFSGGREQITLHYQTVRTVVNPKAPISEILPQLLTHQQSHKQAELEAGSCLSGPHKDDLLVEIDGQNARQFASQGQTRTAALSLKLGAREIFFQDTGEWPVLLLDDVLSELDSRRRDFVLRRINGGQVFITCCEDIGLEEIGAVFQVQNGTVTAAAKRRSPP